MILYICVIEQAWDQEYVDQLLLVVLIDWDGTGQKRRPVPSHLDWASLVSEGFILLEKNVIFLWNTEGNQVPNYSAGFDSSCDSQNQPCNNFLLWLLNATKYLYMWKSPHGTTGLCGGSASGKTTVANKIIEQLGVPWVSMLSLDSFYKVRCIPIKMKLASWDNENQPWLILVSFAWSNSASILALCHPFLPLCSIMYTCTKTLFLLNWNP